MNFLQLSQRTAQECGVSRGTAGPVTVVSQTGELGNIVAWVLTAYEDIQDDSNGWNFLRSDFSFQTIAATSTYLPSAVSLPEFNKWKADSLRSYLTATGISDEQWMTEWDWETFRDARQIGTIQSGRPFEFAIKPDESLVLFPTPDAAYTVAGEYWKRPQTMVANTDEPLFDRTFHLAIVWKAAMYYAADQGASELYATAQNEYKRIKDKMYFKYLPSFTLGGPLV
jgi:hypothetical protein